MAIYRYLRVSRQGEVCILRFAEPNLVNAVAEELGYEFQSVVPLETSAKVLVKFTGVSFLASGFFGKLLSLKRRLNEVGGRLMLSDMSPNIRAAFTAMRLDLVFSIVETEAEALAALEN